VPSVDDPSLYVCTLPDERGGTACPYGLADDGTGMCRRPCEPEGPGPDAPCGPLQTCCQGWCRLVDGADGGVPGGADGSMEGGPSDSSAVDDADRGVGDAGRPQAPGDWVLVDVSDTPFMMGSPRGEPGRVGYETQHEVTLTQNYWMMTTEITQGQFLELMGYTTSNFGACGPTCPAEYTNWYQFAAYMNAASRREGLGECYECTGTRDTVECLPSGDYATPYECPGYRFPTEAEWEYAARGGTTTGTYRGELTATDCTDTTLDPIAWFCGNANNTTHPVASKDPNDYGLYDMLGNVYEWCHDSDDHYPDGSVTDPWGPESGRWRILRGGAYNSSAGWLRAAYRNSYQPDTRGPGYGARASRSEL
jgi:formylglycine-generating enzyme required for sulfatase activity